MPRKRELLKREVWAGDPLVPISSAVLESLLVERGWGPSKLAQHVGARRTNQQNLSDILRSESGRKCRRSLRRRIAQVLEVAEEFLAAEPVIPPYGPFVGEGYEYRYSVRTKLAASRLLTLVANAVRRDIERDVSVREEFYRSVPVNLVFEQAVNWVADIVLVKPWRQKLIFWKPEVEAARGYTEPPTSDPWAAKNLRSRKVTRKERAHLPKGTRTISTWDWGGKPTVDSDHEIGILALIRGAEFLLTPWFEDQAAFNYAGVRDFAHLPNHPFAGIPVIVPVTSPLAVWPPQSVSAPPIDRLGSQPREATKTSKKSPKEREGRS